MKDLVRKWLTDQVGDDDETLLETIYGDYVETIREQLVKAEGEIASGDFVALDVTAHTLKGATLTVGDMETYEAVIALRDAAKGSNAAAAKQALVHLAAMKDLL